MTGSLQAQPAFLGASPLCFCGRSAFTAESPSTRTDSRKAAHATVAFLSSHPQGESEGSGDRLASPDAARRHDPAGSRRHLCLAAARLAGAEEDRADRARGAEPRRRARTADADAATGRPLARERPLRRLRPRNAAHRRPPQARAAVRADQRGNDHRDLPRLHQVVPKPAAQPLSHPVEVPRRAAAAFRRDARARIPDEGCLFVRP